MPLSEIQNNSFTSKRKSISPAFNLQVPAAKPQKMRQNKLPKHLSGPQALAYFAAKKKEKEDFENAKKARILARQKKREEKELERLNKIKAREEKKENKKNEKKGKSGQKRKRITKKESDSSDSETKVVYVESDVEDLYCDIDRSHCPKCGMDDKHDDRRWIGCDDCPRWWHIECCGDPDIIYYLDDLDNYPFTCLYCEM
jgi:DNA repair exonuclease SbcCD ATPase subunit